MNSYIKELAKLILPEYFIITISTILTASLFNNYFSITLLSLIIIFTLVMIGLNTFNSLYDIHIDKLNKPNRPNVSGKIQKKTINFIWISSFLLSIGLAFTISLNIAILTITGVIIAIAYSIPPIRLRSHFVSSSFVGGFTYGAFPYLLVTFTSTNQLNFSHLLLFFGILFAITPLKDIEDVYGDKKNKIKSFPVLFGEIKTINFTTIQLIIINLLFLIFNITNTILLFPFFMSIIIVYNLNRFSKILLTKNYRHTTQSTIVTLAMISVIIIELLYGTLLFFT